MNYGETLAAMGWTLFAIFGSIAGAMICVKLLAMLWNALKLTDGGR